MDLIHVSLVSNKSLYALPPNNRLELLQLQIVSLVTLSPTATSWSLRDKNRPTAAPVPPDFLNVVAKINSI